jgi:hypothetical protein
MADAVEIDLAGVSARLTSDDAVFRDYARLHLAPLRRRGEGPTVVDAELRWHDGPPPRQRDADLAGLERVDRDLYRGDGRLAWFRIDELPGLQLRCRWNGDHLDVTADYYHSLSPNPRRDRLKRWVYASRVEELRRRRFTTLLYYVLYYPCFWWLERRCDLHPIHAAGVEVDGAVVVLAGPSGVGKSTLSTGLSASPGVRFLSDTFLLQRGTTVRAVPEPLLLDAWSQKWIGPAATLMEPIAWRYCLGRDGFHWPAERASRGGSAQLIVVPHRAPQHYVRPLSASQARGHIDAGNFLVNDLRRYWAFAAAFEMLDPSPLAAARAKEIEALTASVPSYEVGLTAELSRERALEIVIDLLDRTNVGSVPGAAASR